MAQVKHCPEVPQERQFDALAEDVQHLLPRQKPDAHALLALQVTPAAAKQVALLPLPVMAKPLAQPLQSPEESQELQFAVGVEAQQDRDRQLPDEHWLPAAQDAPAASKGIAHDVPLTS